MGEAPARSSLVPRDLTVELCLIALASFGLLLTMVPPYGVFESARSYLCHSLRSGLRLTVFWSVVVRLLSVPCLLWLCLV